MNYIMRMIFWFPFVEFIEKGGTPPLPSTTMLFLDGTPMLFLDGNNMEFLG